MKNSFILNDTPKTIFCRGYYGVEPLCGGGDGGDGGDGDDGISIGVEGDDSGDRASMIISLDETALE